MKAYNIPNDSLKILLLAGLSLFGASIALSKTASNILIGLMYLSVALLLFLQRPLREQLRSVWHQPLLAPFVLYLGVAVLGLINTENVHDGIGIVSKLSGLVLIYVMVSVLLDVIGAGEGNVRTAEWVLAAFLVGIAVLDVIALLTYLGAVGHRKFILPVWPMNVHHIWFSNLNAMGIYGALGFLMFRTRRPGVREKIFLYFFVAAALLCVLLSLSRTAWNGLIVTAVVLISFLIKDKRKIFLVLVGVACAIILAYFSNSIVHARLNLVASDMVAFAKGDPDSNIGRRFLLWKVSYDMFLSNPLMGAGTGDFVQTLRDGIKTGVYPSYLIEYNQPHNMYLFALATNGILGLAALLYLLFRTLRYTIPRLNENRENRLFAFLAAATVIHYLVAGMTDSIFNIQMLRYAFAFVIGLCIRRSLFGQNTV